MTISRNSKTLPRQRPGKSGGKRDENRKQQVAKLLRAGLVLFCEQGLEAVRVDEIAAEAGVAKGSFYRYFSDKSNLLDSLFTPINEQLRSALGHAQMQMQTLASPDGLTRVYGALAGAIAIIVVRDPLLLKLYLQENRGPDNSVRRPILELSAFIDSAAWKMTVIAQEHGLLRSNYDAKIGSMASIGAIERLLLAYRREETEFTAAEISRVLIEIILDGVR